MMSQDRLEHPRGSWQPCYVRGRPVRDRRSSPDRTPAILIAVIAILGMLFLMANSKPALSQGVQLVKVDVSVVGKGYRAGKLIGRSVVNDKNENIGKIDDIVIDNNRVTYAVLQVGGFLGVGSRLVAVPYDSLTIDEGGKKVVLPGASKDELKKLAEFKYLG
jgi:sporulation protein YlmC with PRC-barrel domain